MSNVRYKSAVAAGIVVGSAVGVATGILFAPKSGRRTRADIATKTKDSVSHAKDKMNNIKQETKDKIANTSNNINDQINDQIN